MSIFPKRAISYTSYAPIGALIYSCFIYLGLKKWCGISRFSFHNVVIGHIENILIVVGQAIELSAECLSNVKFIQEKKLIGKYFDEISQVVK